MHNEKPNVLAEMTNPEIVELYELLPDASEGERELAARLSAAMAEMDRMELTILQMNAAAAQAALGAGPVS